MDQYTKIYIADRGVETRGIKKAVTNNSDKFPAGHVNELAKSDKNELVENFHQFDKFRRPAANPKTFAGKGLYRLVTIRRPMQRVRLK